MTDVRARKLFPEAGAWRVPVRTGLLAGADGGLLPAKRLGLDRAVDGSRQCSLDHLEDQKTLQRHAWILAPFYANGGYAHEATR